MGWRKGCAASTAASPSQQCTAVSLAIRRMIHAAFWSSPVQFQRGAAGSTVPSSAMAVSSRLRYHPTSSSRPGVGGRT